MTTRTGARIYRGKPRDPLAEGACPHCFHIISVTSSGRRRRHRDDNGVPCTGSGVMVDAPDEYPLDDLPDVTVPTATAYTERLSRSEQPLTLVDGLGVPYKGHSDRPAGHGRAICPGCSRHLPLNSDGTLRRHRIRHQDPLAPYCTPQTPVAAVSTPGAAATGQHLGTGPSLPQEAGHAGPPAASRVPGQLRQDKGA